MSKLQNALVGGVRTVLRRVPASWLPGGTPDPIIEKRATLGTQQPRVDGPDKVRGAARFAAEVPMENLLHAAFVHSTIARGKIIELDVSVAEAAPGVELVMTYRNAPKMSVPPAIGVTNLKAAGNHTLPVMQDAEIRWNGQAVAVILAETREQAEHAATLVRIRYEAQPSRTRFEDGKKVASTPDSILIERNRVDKGNASKKLAEAAYKVDAVYRTPWQSHNPIEPHAATIAWQDGRLIVHDTTQMIHATAGSLAKVFGLKEADVFVSSPFVGGGFGAKGMWDHQILGAAAAKLAGRPVRVRLSRASMHRLVGGRTQTEQRVALGAGADGKLTALLHHGYATKPKHSICDEGFSLTGRSLYASGSFDIVQHHVDLDLVANSFMRAPGEAPGTFAIECAMDELAHELGMDPIELRRRNVASCDPISGAPHSQSAVMTAYDMGAERIGWVLRASAPRARRQGEWLIGMGCAGGTFPFARMPGTSARITLDAGGRAHVASAAQEMGMGTATVQRQHAADRFGLPLDSVSVTIGDSSLPFASFAGGSSQTASLGAAISAASGKLAAELLRLAGNDTPLAGLRVGEVEFADSGLRSVDDPSRYESFASIFRRSGRDEISVTGESGAPLEMLKFSMHSTSAIFCQLRVSEVTGEIRIDRLVGAFDCGRILNAKTATSQFKGGMIMGLGMALTEETLLDERSGRIMSTSLADYHVPVHLDVPEIDVLWTDVPDPRTPMGARGIGEIGTTGVAAAVANAVFNATGIRVRDLPITLDKLAADTTQAKG
ncbi:MAG: xanthine dehydrogenase family protein molybdopterin-binding subunit [Mesorhizobium sp.]|uniref:xanthine dehydrogenase family protein molybdopterin-binding subunit n=1 Tax=Mesorhizobium sp. TaxID=1871066 RepID=UPI000FE639F4|nr:xanthine dehydrogenase family protein molybdopterin-binding subunit [Mesorhizobium sp.]RWE80604.1 MAG: xanthine dehydrogenase family protein molybdopterin-binding subunit [Mesorhizobium sp.]TJW60497.1 MAG: xanthine dehydrogenase family protein molybdopterin-binding subunit [Mesorhizobium sp.]